MEYISEADYADAMAKTCISLSEDGQSYDLDGPLKLGDRLEYLDPPVDDSSIPVRRQGKVIRNPLADGPDRESWDAKNPDDSTRFWVRPDAYPDGSFDIALTSLAAIEFSDDTARRL